MHLWINKFSPQNSIQLSFPLRNFSFYFIGDVTYQWLYFSVGNIVVPEKFVYVAFGDAPELVYQTVFRWRFTEAEGQKPRNGKILQ